MTAALTRRTDMAECPHAPLVSPLLGMRVSMESLVLKTCSICSLVEGGMGLAQDSPQALGVGLVRRNF